MNKIIFYIAALSIVIIQPIYAQWERTNFPLLKNNPPYRIFQFENGLYAANFRSLFKSEDKGLNWSFVSDFNFTGISDIEEIGNTFIATTNIVVIWPETSARVFRSNDGGQTWDSSYCAIFGSPSIEKLNSKLFMALDGDLCCSSDTGKSWTKINTSDFFSDKISDVIASENSLYARIQSEQLFRSDDEGITWTPVLSVDWDDHFYNVTIQDSTIYVGTYNAGCLKSTNSGLSWDRVNEGLPDSSGFRDLFYYEDFIIGAVSKDFYHTVYKINCSDTIWTNFNDGLNLARTAGIHDFEHNKDYLFLASDSSIWRRPTFELVSSININDISVIPENFDLTSFPNPFNNSTTISYQIAKPGMVNLIVYDISGRLIEVLVNGKKLANNYKIIWDANSFASGIYFVRLSTENYIAVRKMLLVK